MFYFLVYIYVTGTLPAQDNDVLKQIAMSYLLPDFAAMKELAILLQQHRYF